MPNAEKKNSGSSFKQRLDTARKMTAEQQRAAKSAAPTSLRQRAKSQEIPEGESAKRASSAKNKKANADESKGKGLAGKLSKRHSTKEERTKTRETHAKSQSEKRKAGFGMPTRYKVVAGVLVLIVAICAILYPVAGSYYNAFRQEQKLQAELDAVNERNEQISKENEELSTDEGVENQAHEELGWVNKNEESVVVTNSGEEEESALPDQVQTEDVQAPQTWYYNILDTIFFVSL